MTYQLGRAALLILTMLSFIGACIRGAGLIYALAYLLIGG